MTADPSLRGQDDLNTPQGRDALISDLFGLNIRGLRSLFEACVRPRRYFEAARDVDWLNRYTPSIRLVLTLVTIMSLLQFLWAGENSALMLQYQSALESVAKEGGLQGTPETAQALIGRYLLIVPFFYIFFHGLSALILRVWGEGTAAVLRLRFYFAGLVPAGMVGLLASVAYAFVPVNIFQTVNTGVFAFVFALYIITFMRAFPQSPVKGRAVRAVGFGVCAVITDFVVSVACTLVLGIWLVASPPGGPS